MASGDLTGFLSGPENAWKVNDLVEDIRRAWMDYQVCALKSLALVVSNNYLRLRYNETSAMRVVSEL